MNFRRTLEDIILSCFHSQTPNSAYYSEASVQLKIGIELYKYLHIDPVLEYKIDSQKEYLDIFCKYGHHKYGIELKYKTSKVTGFDYTTQAAHNNAKYDFLRDIERIESFLSSRNIDIGYSIFITNAKLYWQPAREGTKVKKFDLTDDTCINGVYRPKWKGRTKKINIRGNYKIKWIPEEKDNRPNNVFFRSFIVKVSGQA